MNIIKPAEISSNLKKRLPDIIIGALTLVAGLAWNDAFQDTINNYFPDNKKNNYKYKLLYALILTIIIVIIITIFIGITDKL